MIAFLDACVIIYLIEMKEAQYKKIVGQLKLLRKKYHALTFAASELSLLECRVKPIRDKNENLLAAYQRFFTASNLELVPLSLAVIEEATSLRAHFNLKTPDAIQVACARSLTEEVLFITGDAGFKKISDLNAIIV